MKLSSVLIAFSTLITAIICGGFGFSCDLREAQIDDTTYHLPCKKRDGSQRLTSVDLDDCFANADGELVPRRDGSFGRSCKEHRLEWQSSSEFVTDCRRDDGKWNSNTFDLNTILTNINGHISCDNNRP
ncbi:hypothetical protein BJ508DRAFT_330213 [Ascobolus immersus RN42]|uniref:Cyanovirin-N domain-containing protein n=1 Tax=Ascobolus immersus RN42 TaxID=1160509 RepID=A0A3N4HVX7_ASCIM|nr:hypothetical protein BJ508DRAFT_330213 [Ascobolus immersus RN42]